MKKISYPVPYPVSIEFGSIGKGSKLPPFQVLIEKDSTRLSIRDQKDYSQLIHDRILTDSTRFVEVFSRFQKGDWVGDKNYYDPFVVDGSYMRVSTSLGDSRFANIFTLRGKDLSNISPDSIGLLKYFPLFAEAQSLLKDFSEETKMRY